MPAIATPPEVVDAAKSPKVEKLGAGPAAVGDASRRTTSRRRYGPGWPSARRVEFAFARFAAIVSIRRRSPVRPVAATFIASNRPISAPP